MDYSLLRYPAIGLLFVGLGWLVYGFLAVPLIARPTLGSRGRQRTLALEENSGFRVAEPLIRRIGAVLAELRRTNPFGLGARLSEWGAVQGQRLVEAGYYLGLTEDEYIAMLLVGIGACGSMGAAVMVWTDGGLLWIAIGAGAGYWLIHSQLGNEAASRQKRMDRGLPAALDVAAMCMGAGMDFPGALRQISEGGDEQDVVAQELGGLLRGLELGQTRKQALTELEERVPTDAVRDFTRALIQAEEKGNPIADALRIQATSARMRRSVLAEEAAARAGVFMIIPMMLLMGCILILLMGPFLSGGGSF